MFCDADDIYATDCVKNLIENMERMGVDTAYGYWSSDIKKIENINTTVKQTTQEEMLKHFMYRKTPLSFLNFVYRRDILDAYHIHFNEKFRYGEDNLFFWQYLCHIKTGVYVKAPLYWYYQNPDSAMHNPTWRITDSCEAVKEARNYMRECNFDYIDEFISYMPARTGFHIAKEFARYGMKKEFNRFITEYKMKYEAKKLIHKNGLILTVCSALLYVSPMLFYHMIHIIYTIKFRVNRNGIK
jgi:hypothetical protein